MSWQLRLLNAQLRLIAKPFLHRTKGPAEARRDFERASALFRRPPYLHHLERPNRLHWLRAGRVRAGKAILYFHGGGYVAGSPNSHAGMIGRLSKLSGVEVCAPDYRLAQEAPFPAAFDDAVSAWARLEQLGYAPKDIVLGGDSAGGGLALALLAHLCAQGTPPAGIFVFSPWTDLACTGASLEANKDSDPILPVARIKELVEIYLGNADKRDPRASPLYAEFPGVCPVLIQYSKSEILCDDAYRMADRLRGWGGEVRLGTQEDAPHVWQLFDGWLPEARVSLREAGQFVQSCLD